jgi:hypothetical protein
MTGASPFHELDHRLLVEILQFGDREFGDVLHEDAEALQTHPAMGPQFAGPWIAYVSEFYSRSLAEWFVTARGRSLRRAERNWLEAQRKGWLSVWEIVAVERGRSIDLRDALTHEERRVHEVPRQKRWNAIKSCSRAWSTSTRCR